MIVYIVVKKITTKNGSLRVLIDTVYKAIEHARRRCDEINGESPGNVFATWVMACLVDENYEGEDYIRD